MQPGNSGDVIGRLTGAKRTKAEEGMGKQVVSESKIMGFLSDPQAPSNETDFKVQLTKLHFTPDHKQNQKRRITSGITKSNISAQKGELILFHKSR